MKCNCNYNNLTATCWMWTPLRFDQSFNTINQSVCGTVSIIINTGNNLMMMMMMMVVMKMMMMMMVVVMKMLVMMMMMTVLMMMMMVVMKMMVMVMMMMMMVVMMMMSAAHWDSCSLTGRKLGRCSDMFSDQQWSVISDQSEEDQ